MPTLRNDYALSPKEVKQALDHGDQLTIIDVRTHAELQIAAIETAIFMPMEDVPDRIAEVPRDQPIICMCHHGIRSHRVATALRGLGYDARNMVGGIDAWALHVDPSIPRY